MKKHPIRVDAVVEVDETDYLVHAVVTDWSVGNDGIGTYEYAGWRGFDRGQNFVEDFMLDRAATEVRDYGDDQEPVEPWLKEKVLNHIERGDAPAFEEELNTAVLGGGNRD